MQANTLNNLSCTDDLDESQLDAINAGMKWHVVENHDVIDARGGQLVLFGFISVTYDINGQPSSVGSLIPQ